MGPILYFAITAIQLFSGLATSQVPLKCFLENNGVLNLFASSPEPTFYDEPEFENLRVASVSYKKDGWSYDASNFNYIGLKEAIIDDFGFNFATNVSHITFHTDLFLTGKYKTDGTLFSMPIVGEGIAKVNLANIQMGIIMPFDIIEENGYSFIQLRSFSNWYDVRDNASFELTNLYYGNEELRNTMHYLMNQNWKYIAIRYGQVFMDKVAEKVFNIFKTNMLSVPLRDFSNC